MKKIIFISTLSLLLQSSVSLFSQNQITGIGDLMFGKTFEQVNSMVSNFYSKIEYKNSEIYIRDGILFLDNYWPLFILKFENNILVECYLQIYEFRDQSPTEKTDNNFTLNKAVSYFNSITRTLYLKYSSPSISLPLDNTWIDKYGNSIQVKIDPYNEHSIYTPGKVYNHVYYFVIYKSSLKQENY